jgi:hypothetical protein
MYSAALIILILLVLNARAHSQDEDCQLVTDRPDRTESASTVPSGWLQVEAGYEYLKESPDDNYGTTTSLRVASALFRYGLFDKIELRFAGAFLSQQMKSITSDVSSDGMADYMIGAKIEFINNHEVIPDIALMAHLFLPVGAGSHKPEKFEPQAILSVSKAATDFLDFGTNLGVHYHSSDEEVVYFYTLAAGINFTEKFGTFIEIFSEIFQNESPFFTAGTGLTYQVLPNFQFDVSGGTGLINNSGIWYLGAGFSVRFPR